MAIFRGGYELTSGLVNGLGFCTAESDINMANERFHGPTTTSVIRSDKHTYRPASIGYTNHAKLLGI